MIKTISRGLAVSVFLLLCGCISVGKLDRRADTVDKEVGQTENQWVLLNLARASREEPIYFVALNQVSAGGTTDFRAGAPQFFLGPKLPAVDEIATFASTSTYVDNQTNSSFQMSLLNSKDFYSGLMAPVDLTDVDLMLHQGYSRELIFYLVIDKATITVQQNGKPTTHVVYNDPSNPSFYEFQYYIKEAMEHGLTTETYQAPDDSNDDSSSDSAAGKGPGKPKLSTFAELCYDRALGLPADADDIAPGSFCGDKPSVRQSPESSGGPLTVTLHDKTFPFHDTPLQIDVNTRSIYGMFYYLGRIVRSDKEVDLQPFNLPAETIEKAPLVDVLVNGHMSDQTSSACFTTVHYEGQTYCVPLDGAENTKHIFGILNALLALKQSLSDQPVTETVRIAQ